MPAYNEAANLPTVCGRLKAALGSRPYRLFVVNDGSQDDTAKVAQGLAAEHPLTLVDHPVNRGIAAVFLTGIRAALEGAGDDEPVVIMEGDGTSDPAILPAMVSVLDAGADIAIASRYLPGGAHLRFPLKRLILSHGANALLRLVIRLPGVTDYTIFYRGYRAAVLQRALEAYGDRFIECRGFASNAEILVKTAKAVPLNCGEVAMIYRYDLKPGVSNMKIAKNLLEYLKLFLNVLR